MPRYPSTADPILANSKDKRRNWLETKVLIIDEISMIDPVLFTKLSLIGKLIRENNRPFGMSPSPSRTLHLEVH